MSDIKVKYGTSNQAITCTINSLASNAARASSVIDNATNRFLDALVSLTVAGPTTASTTGYIDVYAYASVDGGSNYTEGATGSDAALTLVSPTNLKWVGAFNVVANSTTYKAGPFSVAQAFGGQLPEKWGIVVVNRAGNALQASGCSAIYQGVYAEAA